MRQASSPIVGRSLTSSQGSKKSSRYAFDPLGDLCPDPFKFPQPYHLVLTTAQCIYTYGSHGITEIFQSGSNGIKTAKRASNVPNVLVIADDHLVILHDIRKGLQKSYRLSSADGVIRTLRYAKGPDRVFFTTTLQNSIQAYDLQQGRLLDPIHNHPSPPTAFALSSTSHLLLSVSNSPSVIQLTTLPPNSRSLLLRPQCSTANVAIVEFHPERGNLFILVFADSTCAVYDAAYMFRGGNGERASEVSNSGTGWELSHIKNLHASRRTPCQSSTDSCAGSHGADQPRGVSKKDEKMRVVAAGFVPSHKTTVVTVGADGRCSVVDFAASNGCEASVICTWDTTGLPSCLTILTPNPMSSLSPPVARLLQHVSAHCAAVLAIGHEDGQVLCFDLAGKLLMHRTLQSTNRKVIDIEWVEGDDWPELSPPQFAPSTQGLRNRRSNKKSLGSVLAGGRAVAQQVIAVTEELNAGEVSRDATKVSTDTSEPISNLAEDRVKPHRDDIGIWESSALNHMDLPSATKKIRPTELHHDDSSSRADTSSSESLGAILRNFQFPSPPNCNDSRAVPEHLLGSRQLPRNNSWAANFQPCGTFFPTNLRSMTSSSTDDVTKDQLGEPVLLTGQRKRRALKDLVNRDPDVSVDENAAHQGNLWTDVGVDVGSIDKGHSPGSSDKENGPYEANPDAIGDHNADILGDGHSPRTRAGQNSSGGKPTDLPFAIHVDDFDQKDHPQPLSAHPEKYPTSGPLALTSLNSSQQASSIRAPFHRQRYKNGHLQSHRSSIYGPGALARKIQQEVMITVNVELDVLRRELVEKFADQREWVEKELMISQEWALRVEDENRKLREELGKERKRRATDKEGSKTLC